MGKINLINKLKTTAIGLSFLSLSLISSGQQNYQPKYNTIAHKYLISTGDTSKISLKKLDDLIDYSKQIIVQRKYNEKEAKGVISEITYILENNIRIKDNLEEEFSTPLFMYPTLEKMLFLAVAKENKLPIYTTLIPKEHIVKWEGIEDVQDYHDEGKLILRWDQDGKHNALNQKDEINKGDFDIDLENSFNIEENILNEENLIKENPLLDKKILKQNIYLTNLTEKQLIGIIGYESSLIYYYQHGARTPKVLEKIDKAQKNFPKLPQFYELKGDYFKRLEENQKAKRYYKKAFKNSPKKIIKSKIKRCSKKVNE